MSNQEVMHILQTCPQWVGVDEQGHGVRQATQDTQSLTGHGMSAGEEVELGPPTSTEPYRDVGMESLPTMTKQEIRAGQKKDLVIGPVLHYKSMNQKPSRSERISGGGHVRLLLKEWRRLVVRDGILYRCIQDSQRGVVEQLVLPEDLRISVKTALHDDSGHLGFERTLHMIRERFYWPRMFQEIKAWCEQCERCCLRKTPTAGVRAPLVSIHSSAPLELVCVDFLTLEKSKGGIENVLVVTDHFSRYAQAYPTKDQRASTVAKVLYRNFFCRFGFPAKLHADQGRNFESAVVKELCKCTGITKTHTTPYHPQGNGTTERFNRTLMNMLGTLEPHLKPRWHEYVDAMTHAYNCTRHDSTGYIPYYLMFGRHPRLPVDLVFGLSTTNGSGGYSEYVQTLHDCLSQAYAQANQASRQAKGHQKRYYDRQAKSQSFSPGDRVLVKVCHVEGRSKLGDKWESRPYIVVKKQPDMPVYVVRSENGDTERVVHRNLLTQCMFLPVEQVGEETREEMELDMEESWEIEDIEDSGEQAGEVIRQEEESDTIEDGEADSLEGGVEGVSPETADGALATTGPQERDTGAGQESEEWRGNETARVIHSPPRPSEPRRNLPRSRHPPNRLTYGSRVIEPGEDQKRIERGWKLWQRAKARRAAGNM
ncbi:unnamed protein product [Oreochromis niloticus]|nr:unnamed protein product [Mustela putorius furo]